MAHPGLGCVRVLRRALICDGTEVAAKAIGAAGCLVPSEVTPIIQHPLAHTKKESL